MDGSSDSRDDVVGMVKMMMAVMTVVAMAMAMMVMVMVMMTAMHE